MLRYRITETELRQHVQMDIANCTDVAKDGVQISPVVMSVTWTWDGREIAEDGSGPVFAYKVRLMGPRRSLEDKTLGSNGVVEFEWRAPDFPEELALSLTEEIASFITETGPHVTGVLVPMAYRWDEL